MNETKTKTIIFGILAVFVIIAAGFLTIDSFLKVEKSSREYLNQKEELKNLQTEKEQLKGISNDKVKDVKNSLENLFSNPNRPLEDILFLENVAEENNLSIDTSVSSEEVNSNPWPYFYLDVNLTGDFSDILSFVNKVKERKWINSVESLKLTKNNEEINGLMKLKVYFLEDTKNENE